MSWEIQDAKLGDSGKQTIDRMSWRSEKYQLFINQAIIITERVNCVEGISTI